MDFALSEDQRAIQDMAASFTANMITPNAAKWDEEHIWPADVFKAGGELGFGSIFVDEEHGGCGLSRTDTALIIEAMAVGCPSTSAMFSIHNMAAGMIARFGNDEQRARLLPKLVTLEHIASYCLTEPSAGSDAAALKTKAVKDGDTYVLNGTKAFISGASKSGVYVIMARTGGEGPKGISCFVVPSDAPGLSFGAPEKKMGWHSQITCSVIMEDCVVSADNLIGGEGNGFTIAMQGLDGGRLNIGACSLGGAQRALDEAIAYTKERKAFGKSIASFQATQFKLADMATELEAARLMIYSAADKVSKKAPDATRAAAMAKRFATDIGYKIVNDALQLFGGYGYTQDYPIEKLVRDLRVHQILEGTNEIMRVIISRDMLKD